MSYSFDVMERAWEMLRGHLPQEVRDGNVATRFGFLINEMHEANHKQNDAVSKDDRVQAVARRIASDIEKQSVQCPHCKWGFSPLVIDQHVREKHS